MKRRESSILLGAPPRTSGGAISRSSMHPRLDAPAFDETIRRQVHLGERHNGVLDACRAAHLDLGRPRPVEGSPDYPPKPLVTHFRRHGVHATSGAAPWNSGELTRTCDPAYALSGATFLAPWNQAHGRGAISLAEPAP